MKNSIIRLFCIIAAVVLIFAIGISFVKPDIENYISISGEYEDNIGNAMKYRYNLPKINANTAYAAQVNGEIEEIYDKWINPALEAMEKGTSAVTIGSGWRRSSFNGITSVILTVKSDWDIDAIHIYNFDSKWNRADNSAVLSAVGMTEEEFVEKARAVLDKETDLDVEGRSEEIINSVNEVREMTLSPENCNADMPIAVTKDGNIEFLAKVYSIAGAGYYNRIFEIAG